MNEYPSCEGADEGVTSSMMARIWADAWIVVACLLMIGVSLFVSNSYLELLRIVSMAVWAVELTYASASLPWARSLGPAGGLYLMTLTAVKAVFLLAASLAVYLRINL